MERKHRRKVVSGCLRLIDCSKIFRKICTAQEKVQYTNIKERRSLPIQCEFWCETDLYCSNWNVGRAGTNYDINVLIRSRLFNDIFPLVVRSLDSERCIVCYPRGRRENLPIYWHILFTLNGCYFSKPLKYINFKEGKKSSRRQEDAREDVERLLGVLKTRFQIIRREFMMWKLEEVISCEQK